MTKDVWTKIQDGDYDTKLPYPKMANALDKEHLQELKKAYKEDCYRLHTQFYADAIEEVGLTGHPKADKVFVLAWEYGHSSGYSEVLNHLSELADLVK